MTELMENLKRKLNEILETNGFELYPFLVGWYNTLVDKKYALPYPDDILAFSIIGTPDVFEKVFIPFICKEDYVVSDNPFYDCMKNYLNLLKKEFPDHGVDILSTFEKKDDGTPKILVQTAGHVAGGIFYYQKRDLDEDIVRNWPSDKYGGWFSFHGAVIFKDVKCPDLQKRDPPDCVPTQEMRKDLLERYNFHYQDGSYRDIIPSITQCSEELKKYFGTYSSEHWKKCVEEMRRKYMKP